MDQFRQLGEVLGSLKVLMVFRNELQINRNQCSLLFDTFNLAFETIAEEIGQHLRYDEKHIKWKALEQPLRELIRIFKEGELYIKQCMESKEWWVKAISMDRTTECVELHLHNLFSCLPAVFEAIEAVAEISGSDQEELHRKKMLFSKKYEKEWLDPKLFQLKFGKQYFVSQEIGCRINSAGKEDRWHLLDVLSEKRTARSTVLTKQENKLADMLSGSKGKLLPTSILTGAKDYQVRRRLGNGSQYKEIQWMGENFAVRHFFGDIEAFAPEIALLSSLAHPNIIQLMCAFSDEERKECFLVMELMNKDLGNYIRESTGPRRKVPFSLVVAIDIMLQIARGMEYLHSHNICHGNLNPSNILVRARNSSPDGYLHVKIAGFGLSSLKSFKTASANQTTASNPCIWLAPEVLLEQEQAVDLRDFNHSKKADVYSFAMVSFELLTGKVPFEDGHLQGNKMSRNVRAGERPLFPLPLPKYLTNLTKRCWQTDPSQRPSFSFICRMLRYIKHFLLLNPDHSQPDPPVPSADYFDIETSLCKRLTMWASMEGTQPVTQIPFQMFAYKVVERDKNSISFKDRSSESGSEGASVCGDENSYNVVIPEDSFPSVSISPPPFCSETNRKLASKKTVNGKCSKQTGQQQKGKPPQTAPWGRSLRIKSESQLQSVVTRPGKRRTSGHASDSDIA